MSWIRFGLAKFLTQITDSIYVIIGGGSMVGTLFPVGLPWVELVGVGLHFVNLLDLQWVGFSGGGSVVGTLFHGHIKKVH